MSTYQELFGEFVPDQWNPPYVGEDVCQIRGIVLPRDYMDFMRRHNGGSFSAPADMGARLVLFSLEEVQKGDCYRDERGHFLGTAWFLTRDSHFLQECARCLFHAFYDDHIVIGFLSRTSGEGTQGVISLVVVDREGHYRVMHYKDLIVVPYRKYGTWDQKDLGDPETYGTCLYETPLGVLTPCAPPADYRIVEPSEIREIDKKYGSCTESLFYRWSLPVWRYIFFDNSEGQRLQWLGETMQELFEFLANKEVLGE